jgi:excisionase family DNA binding protein
MEAVDQETIFSIEEASDFLKLKKSYVYRLVGMKKIKFYKPRGKLYFRKRDLTDYLFGNEVEESLP